MDQTNCSANVATSSSNSCIIDTSNTTGEISRDVDLRVSAITVFFIECLLVLTNLFAIIVFSVGRRSRTDISPLLINLSIADLLTLVWLPMVIVALMKELSFQSLPYCAIMYACQIASILTHLLISVHRYLAIKFPIFVHQRTKAYMVVAILLIWLLSISLAVAGWLAGVCYDDTLEQVHPHIFRNISIFVTLTFILPVCVCCFLYSLTGLELWGKRSIGVGPSARRQLKGRQKVREW